MNPLTHAFQLGNLDCLLIEDYSITAPATRFFSNVSDIELDRELAAHGLKSQERIAASAICLAVKSEAGWVLFDTGHGGTLPLPHNLLPGLKAHGIEPEDIAHVVLSHAHSDHFGGLLDSEGELTFPNADYYVGRIEWQANATPNGLADVEIQSSERAKQLRRYLLPLQPRLHLVENGEEFLPGMFACLAVGHTPGQIIVRVQAGAQCLIYAADVMVHPLHVAHLDWEFFNDGNPRLARRSRAEFVRCAVREQALVMAYHFVFPGTGCIQEQDGGYVFSPISL